MISFARYPLMRSAPAFQVATRPVRVEHEDGVLLTALDEKTKALFAFAERFLGLAPLGEVPRNLGVTQQSCRQDRAGR